MLRLFCEIIDEAIEIVRNTVAPIVAVLIWVGIFGLIIRAMLYISK